MKCSKTADFMKKTAAFFELIRSGVQPFSDLESGMQAVELADLIRNRVKFYRATEEE